MVQENPYFEEPHEVDEEESVGLSSVLKRVNSDVMEEVVAKNLEIPRDCLKLTGKRLGRGHFGEVHQALLKTDNDDETLCAAKMPRGKRSACGLQWNMDISLQI